MLQAGFLPAIGRFIAQFLANETVRYKLTSEHYMLVVRCTLLVGMKV